MSRVLTSTVDDGRTMLRYYPLKLARAVNSSSSCSTFNIYQVETFISHFLFEFRMFTTRMFSDVTVTTSGQGLTRYIVTLNFFFNFADGGQNKEYKSKQLLQWHITQLKSGVFRIVSGRGRSKKTLSHNFSSVSERSVSVEIERRMGLAWGAMSSLGITSGDQGSCPGGQRSKSLRGWCSLSCSTDARHGR